MWSIIEKSDTSVINNHRAICLLSGFSKVFGIAVHENIIFNVQPLISPSKHGFLNCRNTVTSLGCLTQLTNTALDNHQQMLNGKFENLGFSFNLSILPELLEFYVESSGYQSYTVLAFSR